MSTALDPGTRPVGVFGRLADLGLTSDDAGQSVRWTPAEPRGGLVWRPVPFAVAVPHPATGV